MKRALSIFIAFAVMLLNTPVYGNDEAFSENDYESNESYEGYHPLGNGASKASSSSVSASMVGWGIGLAVAVAILAGVLHQSKAAHSSSNGSTSST